MESTKKRMAWYRSPIDRQVLSELSRKRDGLPLIHVLAQLGFSGATGAVALWAFHNVSWPWVAAAVYFHCSFYGFFGSGTGGHELSHRTVFKTKALNEFFIRLNGFLTWFNFIHFRHSHAGHHKFTVHDDLDMEVILPRNLRWYNWLLALTIDPPAVKLRFSMLFRQAFGRRREVVLKSEWEQRVFPAKQPEALRRLVGWSRFLLGGHAALALIFILSGNWILLLLVTFAPFSARWFVVLTHFPQHAGMRPDVADWRQSTRTYLGGPIVNFFYWNMNYHVEHHMYAAVPFYNLPKLRKAIQDDLPFATKGLIATWREIITTLRQQKRDPDFSFRPELPDTASAYLDVDGTHDPPPSFSVSKSVSAPL